MLRFGLLRFGLPGSSDLRIRLNLTAAVAGEAHLAKDLAAPVTAFAEEAGAQARMNMDILLSGAFTDALGARLYAGKNLAASIQYAGELRAEARLAKDITILNRPGRIRGVAGGRFGLMPFGLSGGMVHIGATINCSERLSGLASAGKNLPAVSGGGILAEAVRGALQATAGLRSSIKGQAVLLGRLRLDKDLRAQIIGKGAVHASVSAVKNIQVLGKLAEQARIHAYLAKNLQIVARMSSTVQASLWGAVDVRFEAELAETISALVSPAVLEQEVFFLDVTIPPGGVITIDSDSFEAYLNNARILHLQSGDWIHLDRGLINLFVDTGTGGALDGSILFSERFL